MASAAKPAKKASEERDDELPAPPSAPAAARRGLLLPMMGSALLAAALAGGASWFVQRHASERPAPAATAVVAGDNAATEPTAEADATNANASGAPALYLDLTPAFVVNLADEESTRFLQVEIELMARDSKAIDAAKDHMPRIRNALLMLFAQQHAHDLSTREAKEKLQKDALEEVQRALRDEKVPAAIEAVYFTAFVIQ